MSISHVLLGGCLLPALLLPRLHAADPSDRSQYGLINPTPADLMRPFVSDQTMFTLTPYTVDAGHFQFETDLFDYYHDRDRSGGGDTRYNGWSFGAYSELKVGLLDWVDFEFGFTAYTDVVTADRVAGTRVGERGFSNISPSFKISLWGNNGGDTALAIVPSISIPTSQLPSDSDGVTGGILVPFSARLPWDLTLGLMTGFSLHRNDADEIHPNFVNGVSLRRPLAGRLDIFTEFITYLDEEANVWSGDINSGLAYRITPNMEVDAGITFGVHNDVDYNPYVGFSWRF